MPPQRTFAPDTITSAEIAELLTAYDEYIERKSASVPDSSQSLITQDKWRRTRLPELARDRDPPHITKTELVTLMECKLKRGKWRPLAQLIASNEESSVVEITRRAFAMMKPESLISDDAIMGAVKEASRLRGVGPATSTFVLAAYCPSQVPIFSDEGFRWVFYEETVGKGWDRKLKYDTKEYKEYLTRIRSVASRVDVSVNDVERVAFILGQRAISGEVHLDGKQSPSNASKSVRRPQGRVGRPKAHAVASSRLGLRSRKSGRK